eukprot:CAMPEP_0174748496 /NCGR_PEP_ID=MMETSP1094-20130205/93629_1 /TAXON_ID=156173 /ORGANISM="Chrysochromulina brevifilum, Strain UTEX LB 985" /LENGTH=145 /DNA_ID=CAMNT_0015953547 /DNA_START=248 /DNA_END=685 /DNA_ORIENTATION=-
MALPIALVPSFWHFEQRAAVSFSGGAASTHQCRFIPPLMRYPHEISAASGLAFRTSFRPPRGAALVICCGCASASPLPYTSNVSIASVSSSGAKPSRLLATSMPSPGNEESNGPLDDAWIILPRTGASSGHMYMKSTELCGAPSC